MLSVELQTTYDGLDASQAIIATYFMEVDAGQDVVARARQISRMIYPGAWMEPHGATAQAWENHSARIVSLYETPAYELDLPTDIHRRQFILQLAIPTINVDQSLATLMTTVAGEIFAFGNLKLLDLYFPSSYSERFSGPKFGVEGIRRILGVEKRPLLLAIMKPSQGYSAEAGADAFRQAAIGGADIIKDEELLSDPAYCRRTDRIKLYMQAEKQAYEETGEHTLYCVNITDDARRIMDNALQAIELGANALLLNYVHVGLDAAREITEDPRINVPILGHNSGSTTLFANPYTGVSSSLIGAKLPRMVGFDMGILLSGLGSFPGLQDRVLLVAREMLSPYRNMPPMLPMIASGVTDNLVAAMVKNYGTDIAIGAGTTVFGYSEGATAGARALRAAIDAALQTA